VTEQQEATKKITIDKSFIEKFKRAGWIAAVTAMLTTLFTFMINYREISLNEFNSTSKILQDQIDDLRKDNSDLKLMVNLERNKTQQLSTQLSAVIALQYNRPFPEWVKLDGKMILLNKKYEDIFLRPRNKVASDYILKTDLEIWPEDIANKFIANDQYVIQTGSIFYGVELIPDKDGVLKKWIILKYPFEMGVNSPKKVAVAGIAIPAEVIEKNLKND
jgi:PAS domain-containing protein